VKVSTGSIGFPADDKPMFVTLDEAITFTSDAPVANGYADTRGAALPEQMHAGNIQTDFPEFQVWRPEPTPDHHTTNDAVDRQPTCAARVHTRAREHRAAPARRRAAASSSTSSADPGDDGESASDRARLIAELRDAIVGEHWTSDRIDDAFKAWQLLGIVAEVSR
jgi:hypothetical protein